MTVLAACPWCRTRLGDLLMCPPAKRVLDALAARGQASGSNGHAAPVHVTGTHDPDSILLGRLSISGAMIPGDDGQVPALVFTGSGEDVSPAVVMRLRAAAAPGGRVRVSAGRQANDRPARLALNPHSHRLARVHVLMHGTNARARSQSPVKAGARRPSRPRRP